MAARAGRAWHSLRGMGWALQVSARFDHEVASSAEEATDLREQHGPDAGHRGTLAQRRSIA